jgi:hypothetical protein
MSIREDFNEAVKGGFEVRVKSQETRPNVEVWPEEDDFGRCVGSHEDPVRGVVCGTPEFKDSPFCGRGHH